MVVEEDDKLYDNPNSISAYVLCLKILKIMITYNLKLNLMKRISYYSFDYYVIHRYVLRLFFNKRFIGDSKFNLFVI